MKENKISRNNTIEIVGHIKTKPELVVEAADWEQEIYETRLTRMRPNGMKDTYILQFDGHAAGSKEMLAKITEGAEVFIGGEIRSRNMHNPKPGQNRVKVYIYAEVIAINEPPVNDQNEVKICGNICMAPYVKIANRKVDIEQKKKMITSIVVAVKSPVGTNYIHCVCFEQKAFKANTLKIGDYVEIYGRFQSRDYKKRIAGRTLPYLHTAYEVYVIGLKSEHEKRQSRGEREIGG